PSCGYVEIGILLSGPSSTKWEANQAFLNTISFHKREYTGWSPFVHITNPKTTDLWPYVYDDGWEAKLDVSHLGVRTFDFWRMDPAGRFYTLRAFQDDMVEGQVQPKTVLDPILHLKRLAEALATGLSFAEGMQYDLDVTEIAFAFRWTGL